MKRYVKIVSPLVITLTFLTACNNTSDMKKSEQQQQVDNLSNKINTHYKKRNGEVKKDGRLNDNGVVNDRESRRTTNQDDNDVVNDRESRKMNNQNDNGVVNDRESRKTNNQ